MQEYIEIFFKNQQKIESFIERSIENVGSLTSHEVPPIKELYETFISLELVYIVDYKSRLQISSNIYGHKEDSYQKGKDRSYLFSQLKIKENHFAFSSPYQSSATNNLCLTVSKKEADEIVFMDFNLEKLLTRLGLIERHATFSQMTKSFYVIAGFFMMLLSTAAILYAVYDFTTHLLNGKVSIDTIFKPVIATTLGLAIFDLAKTILEQEVFFKSYSYEESNETRTLTKFLITVLIALGIETLMVVFKIAIDNYEKMINALYLMGGISLIIVAITGLIYVNQKVSKH